MDALLEVRATRFARGALESLAASTDDAELASGAEHSEAVSSNETGEGVAVVGVGRLRAASVGFLHGG